MSDIIGALALAPTAPTPTREPIPEMVVRTKGGKK